jgi:hypothetical protein
MAGYTYTTSHEGLTRLDVSSKFASIADSVGVLVLAHVCGVIDV